MSDNLVKQLRAKNAYCAPDFSTPIADPVKLKAAYRIEELEAKLSESEALLAKAVEALEKVRAFVRELEPYADQGHTLVPALHDACTTLAELKGEK